MARKLKIWNGGGWGSPNYGENGKILPTPLEEYVNHLYVCAHSKAEVVMMVNQAGGFITVNEVNNYWNEGCWGNQMEGIEPELGVWASQNYNDKPVKIYPKTTKI